MTTGRHEFSWGIHTLGTEGFGSWPTWPPQGVELWPPPRGAKLFERKITKNGDSTLPPSWPPGTIMFFAEKFLSNNAFYPFLTVGETPWDFRKKISQSNASRWGFSKIDFNPPPGESYRAHLWIYFVNNPLIIQFCMSNCPMSDLLWFWYLAMSSLRAETNRCFMYMLIYGF